MPCLRLQGKLPQSYHSCFTRQTIQIRIGGSRTIDLGHFDGIAHNFIIDGKIATIIESEQAGRRDKASNIQQPGTRKFDA